MGSSQSITTKFKEDFVEQLLANAIYPSPDVEVIKARSRRPTKPAPQGAQKIELHAQPVQTQNESKINAVDGRRQVLETAKWPNSVHGVIAFRINNIMTWGTGVLIGPQIVLTAGSNIYDIDTKAYADVKNMQFLPGMNGKMLPFGAIEVEEFFVSPNYIEEGKEDYGILILKKKIGEKTGYFGLACLEPEEIKAKKINVAGYPSDKVEDKPNTFEMWGMEAEASHIDETQGSINYFIDTYNGQSGSGVWFREGEDYYVCGIHKTGNAATLLTRAMYKQIHAWVQQVGFNELLFRSRNQKELILKDQELNAECISLLTKQDDLTILQLNNVKMGNKEAKILARNTSWVKLSKLNLHGNKIEAKGAKALAQNTSWTKLSELNLYCNPLGTEGAKGLAQNTSWINLSYLSLGDYPIGAEGVKALAKNTSWTKLSTLYFNNSGIGVEGAKALAQNTSWTNLSQLHLTCNSLGAKGAKALAQNTSWINLSKLDLWNNRLTAEGAKALAQNTSWINLSQLNLMGNHFATEGAKALAQNKSWVKLSELNLCANDLYAGGVKALAQNTSWVTLSKLTLK